MRKMVCNRGNERSFSPCLSVRNRRGRWQSKTKRIKLPSPQNAGPRR